jgi:hypothetical protein
MLQASNNRDARFLNSLIGASLELGGWDFSTQPEFEFLQKCFSEQRGPV